MDGVFPAREDKNEPIAFLMRRDPVIFIGIEQL
jgi:hypothetical protein